MKQPGSLVKVLAIVTSLGIATAYVVYRVANAKPDEKPTRSAAPVPPRGGGPMPPKPTAPATPDLERDLELMGGSKSLAPLIQPKDLKDLLPEARPPEQTTPNK